MLPWVCRSSSFRRSLGFASTKSPTIAVCHLAVTICSSSPNGQTTIYRVHYESNWLSTCALVFLCRNISQYTVVVGHLLFWRYNRMSADMGSKTSPESGRKDRGGRTMQLKLGRSLTRSNALAVKSPDQFLDLPLALAPPFLPLVPTTTPSAATTTTSSIEFLGVCNNRRRHSDSYFPQKRHRRRHQMRGLLHPKYSYSPNPR